MAKRTTSSKTAKTPQYTLCHATDLLSADGGRTLASAYTPEYGGVSVAASAGWYWVERLGQYTRNERYMTPGQVLVAIGAGEADAPVWRLLTH